MTHKQRENLPKLAEITEAHVGVPEAKLPDETIGFQYRRAVRALLLNDKGEVAILNVKRDGYHKLPGGGAEYTKDGKLEDGTVTLEREAMEETGYNIEILDSVGQIVEGKDTAKMLQISECYVARVVGEPKKVGMTEDEVESGMELEWMPLDKAIKTLEQDSPDGYLGKFILKRDIVFLKRGKEIMHNIMLMRDQTQRILSPMTTLEMSAI